MAFRTFGADDVRQMCIGDWCGRAAKTVVFSDENSRPRHNRLKYCLLIYCETKILFNN